MPRIRYVCQFLVGVVNGNPQTGCLELVDNTGRLPLACVLPCNSQVPLSVAVDGTDVGPRDSILGALEEIVMISNFNILVEKTDNVKKSPNASCEMKYYVYAKDVCISYSKRKGVPPSTMSDNSSGVCNKLNPIPAISTHLATSVTDQREVSPAELIVKVINKNQVLSSIMADSSYRTPFCFTAQALMCSNDSTSLSVALNFSPAVFHLYSYINNGCMYQLTSKSPGVYNLPSLRSLIEEPCINVVEGVRIVFVKTCQLNPSSDPILDVAEVVSMVHLPSISTMTNRGDSKEIVPR